jgi:hypothetical protein
VGAPICRPKRSPGKGRFSESGEQWRITFPSSSSSSSSSLEDSDSEGVSPPSPPLRTFAAARATLLCRSFYFRARCLSFSMQLASCLAISLSKMTPRGSLCTHPRPNNMSTSGIKKAKIDTIKWKQARANSSRGGQPCPSRELGRSQSRSVSLP